MIPLSPVRQRVASHWALFAACAVFLLVGALSLQDYGSSWDNDEQRAIGQAALDSLAGDGERAFDQLANASDRYYGAVLEAPLVLLERALSDSGKSTAVRHLLSHFFYLIGGIFCYLLVYRLFNNRMLALIAMLLFLLHPRMYAHSFFNSKDIPFLAMFMVTLSLVHRAFRRDTLAAFALCGAGAGLLVNLRVMGIILVVAVLVLRALDLPFAGSGRERARILLTGGAFTLTVALMLYASLPALWGDPAGQFVEMLRVFTSHPHLAFNRFGGEWLYSRNGPPFDYVPVWVGITTPPAMLLLALAGAISLAWRGRRRPRDILRNGPLRFGFLLLALPVGTAVAVFVLGSNVYHDWRQLYFMHAPLLLLAVFGLHWLASSLPERRTRAGIYALAGAGAAIAIVSMVRIHPYEAGYFNTLTDRATAARLASRYDIFVRVSPNNIPAGERGLHELRRAELSPHELSRICSDPRFPGTRDERLYANTLRCLLDPAAYFGTFRGEALATEPLDRSRFDAYRVGSWMVYLRDGCTADDLGSRVFLHVHPVDHADLPDYRPDFFGHHRKAYGFEQRDFTFSSHGARMDGTCVAVVPLPDYPIARIHTDQFTPEYAAEAWRAVADGEPLVRALFDIYRTGAVLTYTRADCSADDLAARFALHIYPVDERALPDWQAEHGFDNLDFNASAYGARTEDGRCVVTVPLPTYPIAYIHTGQFQTGANETRDLWSARFPATRPHVSAAALAGEPLASAIFNVYRDGDRLIYVRDGCTEEDAGPAFGLHFYPADPDDLSEVRREYGFASHDFFLWQRAAHADGGRCVAVVPLPDYPVASVQTGQYDETGRLWWVEFALPGGE